MSNFIPLFPLKLVAFPGEQVNLHIFEERYKQLVADVRENHGVFGVCVFLERIMPVGTEVRLNEVVKTYDDGRMDVSTKAIRVFEVVKFSNPAPTKLYAGGSVQILEDDPIASITLHGDFITLLSELFKLMQYDVDLMAIPVDAYTYAHQIGLKLEEEYELLLLTSEAERIIFLIKHLVKIIPVLKEIEEAKRKIKLNGHFKLLDPLDF